MYKHVLWDQRPTFCTKCGNVLREDTLDRSTYNAFTGNADWPLVQYYLGCKTHPRTYWKAEFAGDDWRLYDFEPENPMDYMLP